MAPQTLGERIRELRQERGLSLAKVARGDFSRAFLNQVEMGKSRPSPKFLALIAARLGTTTEYLLEGGQPLLEAEITVERAFLLLAQGNPRRALAEVEPLLDATELPAGTDARLCAAESLVALGDVEQARRLAETELAQGAAWLDESRQGRWSGVLQGRVRLLGAGDPALALKEHARLADRLLREGRPLAAVEQYRAARRLAEALKPPAG